MQVRQYWIAVVAQDRAERARAGAYAELNQGRPGVLERVRAGDGFVFYSPRTFDPKGEPLQAFTALGEVTDGYLYRVEHEDGSSAFRVAVDYRPSIPAPIKPLLDQLSFIHSKQYWGACFRFGALRIPAGDFSLIAAAMGGADDAPHHSHLPSEAQENAA